MLARSLLQNFKSHYLRQCVATRSHSASSAPVNSKDKYKELEKLARRPLYLDAQATLPIDPRVLDAMLPYMTNMYGNPHSRTHAFGWESEKAVEHAREVFNRSFYNAFSLIFQLVLF